MEKTLIISDSHGEIIANILKNDRQYQSKQTEGTEDSLINFTNLDMLILAGRTGYNFSNHLGLIEKDYSNHHVIFFMGYNDLAMLYGRNIEKTVHKYISQVDKFKGSSKTVITPLSNRQLPQEYYDQYIFYIKRDCQEIGIKCLDVYEIIENITDQDYQDEHHLNTQRYLPILDHI